MTEVLTFPAPNGNPVALNTSTVSAFLLPALTAERLHEVVAEHERIRIELYWEEELLRPCRGAEAEWVEALRTRQDANGWQHQVYFQADALRDAFQCDLQGKELTDYLRSLPIAEQQATFRRQLPTNRDEMRRVLRLKDAAFAPDFRAMLAEHRTIPLFIEHLVEAARTNVAPLYHQSRYLELLTLLWSHGLILFPLDLPAWKVKYKWVTTLSPVYARARWSLVEGVLEAFKLTNYKGLHAVAHTFFLATDVSSVEDLSLELVAAHEHRLMELAEADHVGKRPALLHSARSKVTRVGQTLRVLFNKAYPDLAVQQTRTKRFPSRKGPLRSDGKFLWLAAARPKLAGWGDLMRTYVGQLTTVRIAGQVDRLNFLGDYLVSLREPPLSPEAVVRHQHIYDPTLANKETFYEFLREKVPGKARASSILNLVRTFCDWYGDYLIATKSPYALTFRNPVLSTDTFGSGRQYDGQTPRDALPSYVLEELKSVLIEDDFAFAKSMKGHYETVADLETGKVAKVWAPMLTVCLYLMLELPLRSHQARWIDSGLLDEAVYDRRSNRYGLNDSPYAIRGRREGALRLQHDSLRKANWLGLWVNTNKTAALVNEGAGYLVPYVSDRLADLLAMVQAWQLRHLPPIQAPVAYYDVKHMTAERQRVADRGPQIAPLFREVQPHVKDAPISYGRLSTFYTLALAEVQARIKRKHGHDLSLVTRGDDGELRWVVDLHSLRVSGITAMIENGVPIEVVSLFVAGHATLVMTLHYLKYSPLKIRALLSEAHSRAQDNIDFVGSEMFMGNLDSFAPFMLGQEGPGTGAGVGALREKTGIFTIAHDGICPGTSCDTGGPVDTTKIKHGPVPGGQRCGMCRYWITGPAHLLGQVASVNNLAYVIRKKGLEVAALNSERLDAEDAGDARRAREIRDRVDLLNRELAIDIDEWAARYRYAEQSVNLLNDYLAAKAQVEGGGLPVPFLTSGTAAELKVTLEETHEFALLDQITQLSEFVTGFKNREAELEKTTILSRMMDANGLKPFLLSLDERQAHEAANMLSALLLQQVNTRELDDVLSGRKSLVSYPQLNKAIALLGEAGNEGTLPSSEKWDAVSRLPHQVEAANTNDDEAEFA